MKLKNHYNCTLLNTTESGHRASIPHAYTISTLALDAFAKYCQQVRCAPPERMLPAMSEGGDQCKYQSCASCRLAGSARLRFTSTLVKVEKQKCSALLRPATHRVKPSVKMQDKTSGSLVSANGKAKMQSSTSAGVAVHVLCCCTAA